MTTKPSNKYIFKISSRLIAFLFAFACSIGVLILIMHEIISEKEESLDRKIITLLSTEITSDRTALMTTISYFASSNFLILGYALLISAYTLGKSWLRAIEIFLIGSGGFLLTHFLKIALHRDRPELPLIAHAPNFSFPSGHAASAFIFYGLIAYLIWQLPFLRFFKLLTTALLFVFVILIGFSRVYLRVHYATDVLAGFFCGAAWLLFSIIFMDQLKKSSPRRCV